MEYLKCVFQFVSAVCFLPSPRRRLANDLTESLFVRFCDGLCVSPVMCFSLTPSDPEYKSSQKGQSNNRNNREVSNGEREREKWKSDKVKQWRSVLTHFSMCLYSSCVTLSKLNKGSITPIFRLFLVTSQ